MRQNMGKRWCRQKDRGPCRRRVLLAVLTIMMLPWIGLAGEEDRINFPKGPWAFRVFYEDGTIIHQLGAMTEPRLVHRGSGNTLIFADDALLDRLADLPVRLEYDAEQTAGFHGFVTRHRGNRTGIVGFPCYPTLTETEALLQTWETNHPNLVSLIDIGDSWEKINTPPAGFDLWVARLTNQQLTGPKPILFVMSSIHAREYTTAPLISRFGSYLLDRYGLDPDITWLLDHHEIHLLPVSNPDGRIRAEQGLSWRKNADNDFCSDTVSRGVDLNRNFPFQWGCCGGGSDLVCADTYRGPSAVSEPEIMAITNYVRSIFPDNRGPALSDPAPDDAPGIFLDVHSFGDVVIWPYGFDNTPTPNGSALRTMGRKLAFFNQYFPERASVLFNTDGTTDDFAYGELGVASFTFELGSAFFQDCRDFEEVIWPDNLNALLYAAKAARAPYLLPGGPEPGEIQIVDNILSPGESLELTVSLDDGRFNQSNGMESIETIASAEAWLDQPPWQGSGTPIAMTAQDGAFDEAQELATVSLSTTGLAEGNHKVFVRGEDSTDRFGVVSAGLFSVLDPATSARFFGKVREWASGRPLVAEVSNGPFAAMSEVSSGDYELLLIPGDYQLTAIPGGHGVAGPLPAILPTGTNVQLDWDLVPSCAPFSEDGEQGPGGWQANGGWVLSDEVAHTGQFAWNDSPGGAYAPNAMARLVSPPIDLRGFSTAQLSFWQRHIFVDLNDFGTISWSSNGTDWQELLRVNGIQTVWTQRALDLSAAIGFESVQFRFELSSNATTHGDGWQIDDIQLTGISPRCLDGPGRLLALARWPQPLSVLTLVGLEPMVSP